MRTIHLYISRQILATLLLTVTVFTFVLLLGNVLKEIVTLLQGGHVTFLLVLKALGLLLPYVLVFALPIGLLTAVLLFFGRLSADQELTALRSNGIGPSSLVLPVVVIALLLSLLCASINLWIGPWCRAEYKNLVRGIDLDASRFLFTEDTFIRDIPGYWIHIGGKDGEILQDIRIFTLDENGVVDGDFSARRGRLILEKDRVRIRLDDTVAMFRNSGWKASGGARWSAPVTMARWESDPVPLEHREEVRRKPKIGNMTWSQLREELADRRRALGMSASETGEDTLRTDILLPVQVQMHRLASFSFACLSFSLVGIPLGIRSHRRETTIGIAVALVLLAVYYAFLIAAKSLDTRPEWHPELIVWIPNFLFQGMGCYLIWRSGRGV